MRTDLAIHSYATESAKSYCSRVTYSGLGEWIKTAAYDKYIEDDSDYDNTGGASKSYITSKVQEILNSYIEIIPIIKTWYYPESEKHPVLPIQEIRDRIYISGFLVSNKMNTLQFPPAKCTKISDSLYLYRGDIHRSPDCVIGLGTYVKDKGDIPEVELAEMFNLPKKPANIFVDDYLKNVRSKFIQSDYLPESREYFNHHSIGAISKSWSHDYKNQNEVTVYRDNYNDYGLIKTIEGVYNTSAFPSSYIDLLEIRRFIYGLWYKTNHAAKVKIEKHDTLCSIRLPSHLPAKEQSVLYLLAWPSNDIMDKTEYIAPIEVLPVIEKLFKGLCMDVIYK
ncbi:MAG: hypothetical protein PHF76_10230 [Bacteroidales bacterium]|nr:hypothetical protein [Bacteroidales bacterium]